MGKRKSFLVFCAATSILLFSFPGKALSENWYLINEYDITTDNSKTFRMRVVARVKNKDFCYELAGMRKGKLAGGILISTDCVSGEEYDKALEGVFRSVPTKEPYITLIDKYENETIIDFLSVPKETIVSLVKKIAERFRKEGFLGVRIISHKEKEQKEEKQKEKQQKEKPAIDILVIGSTEEDVKDVKGAPDETIGRVWFYGKDMVIFGPNGKIIDYSDFSETLGIKK